jgi:N-acetylglutamate synthase-like GNAT family acetyltransferase
MPGIAHSLLANKVAVSDPNQTFWWIAEVQGLTAGTVGITAHPDCAELTGLTVDPFFRGKGLGHAMVEYACDQWTSPLRRRKVTEGKTVLNDKLWLTTATPAYFLPVNFVMADAAMIPKSLKDQMTGSKAKWTGMRHQLYKL